MLHLLHQSAIVWRRERAEQERDAEFRRRALESATAARVCGGVRAAFARFVRRPA